MGRLRDKIKTDPDAGLHALRHTFLTEAGEYTDACTLQYIAGHDTIKTTTRYVYPRAESISRRISRKKKPAQSAWMRMRSVYPEAHTVDVSQA